MYQMVTKTYLKPTYTYATIFIVMTVVTVVTVVKVVTIVTVATVVTVVTKKLFHNFIKVKTFFTPKNHKKNFYHKKVKMGQKSRTQNVVNSEKLKY